MNLLTQPQILFEDNHLLVVNKPAGMLSQGDGSAAPSILEWGKAYIANKYNKAGAVFLGPVHRLDRPVSGIVVMARTSKAASRLSQAFRDRSVKKIYRAIVEVAPVVAQARLEQWLRPAAGTKPSEVFDNEQPGTQHVVLSYRSCEPCFLGPVLEIELETGRKHQIRAQLAVLGSPILGDTRYGGKKHYLPGAIALHAYSLTLPHPIGGQLVTFSAAEPWRTGVR